MPPLARLLLAAAPLMFFAADDKSGGGGAAPAKLSIADQLTAAQARVTELEGLQTAWTGERASLTTARDTAQGEVTTVRGLLSTVTGERDAALTRATTAEGQISALTKERDDAVKLAKNPSEQAARIMAENPSTAARAILSLAGGPAVPSQSTGATHPGEAGKVAAANLAGKTGVQRAMAKNIAKAEEAARK